LGVAVFPVEIQQQWWHRKHLKHEDASPTIKQDTLICHVEIQEQWWHHKHLKREDASLCISTNNTGRLDQTISLSNLSTNITTSANYPSPW
jgi:hypothetical protein